MGGDWEEGGVLRAFKIAGLRSYFLSWEGSADREWVCAQSCLTLWAPKNSSPPGSLVHGIIQARILEWVAICSSRGSSVPRDPTWISCGFCIGRQILYHWEGSHIDTKRSEICSVVSNSLRILQARILEWVAFPFSRGSSQPRDRTQFSRIAGGFFTSWARSLVQVYSHCSHDNLKFPSVTNTGPEAQARLESLLIPPLLHAYWLSYKAGVKGLKRKVRMKIESRKGKNLWKGGKTS